MQISLSHEKMKMLFRLFTERMNPGTRTDYARRLDPNASGSTAEFINELVRPPILILKNVGEREIGYRRHPIYEIDRIRLAEVWKKRPEYLFSVKIIEDENKEMHENEHKNIPAED